MPTVKPIWLLTSLVLLLSGCGYSKLAVSKVQSIFHTTPENIKVAAPENCLLASGRISGDRAGDMQMAVAAVTRWESMRKIVDYCLIKGSSPFFLYLHEGDYQFLLFADLNRDSVIDQNELVGSWNNMQELRLDRHRAANGIFRNIDISARLEQRQKSEIPFRVAVPDRKYGSPSKLVSAAEITRLDDERFSDEISAQGLYKPAGYFEQVDHFFYMLEEYDPSRIPVIFVHGMGGTPRDWAFFVSGMDRKRFQPWFFYYPSGLRLETAADIFYETFFSGKNAGRKKPVIVAHSQGGLVARAAMNRLTSKNGQNHPRLFISFCTPYGGVTSAAVAISKKSPVIIPSWIDLASNSIFLESIFKQPPHPEILFHLFFAYGSNSIFKLGPNDDGLISLKSQLDHRAQNEALRLHGFNETHSGILGSKAALDSFNSILEKLK